VHSTWHLLTTFKTLPSRNGLLHTPDALNVFAGHIRVATRPNVALNNHPHLHPLVLQVLYATGTQIQQQIKKMPLRFCIAFQGLAARREILLKQHEGRPTQPKWAVSLP
jgi:hypothetical protein